MGRRQVNAVVSSVLRVQMGVLAGRAGVSLQEWMVEAFREKVVRDGFGGVGSVVDRLGELGDWSSVERVSERFEESA